MTDTVQKERVAGLYPVMALLVAGTLSLTACLTRHQDAERGLKDTLRSIQPPMQAWGRGYSDLQGGNHPYVKGFFLADLTAEEALSYYVQEFRRHDFVLKEDNKLDSPRLLRFCGKVYQADVAMTRPEHSSQPLRYEIILRLKDTRCD